MYGHEPNWIPGGYVKAEHLLALASKLHRLHLYHLRVRGSLGEIPCLRVVRVGPDGVPEAVITGGGAVLNLRWSHGIWAEVDD